MICSRNGDETGCCVPNDMTVYILFIIHVSHNILILIYDCYLAILHTLNPSVEPYFQVMR